MDSLDLVRQHYTDSIQTKIMAADSISEVISQAGQTITQALINGNKIFTCGHGGGAANAQYLATLLVNRFEMERPPLPAIALTTNTSSITAIASDYQYDRAFSKQLYALAHPNDILIIFMSPDQAAGIGTLLEVSREKQLINIIITGEGPTASPLSLTESDIEIKVPSNSNARIQENHTLITHCLCDIVDQTLFSL